MQTFVIRRFYGVRNSVESSDAPRGTMRKAEGVLCSPAGSIVGGPSWALAWSQNGITAAVTSALSGADSAKVHFVTITRGSAVFLLAWDLAASRSVGAFYVGTASDPTAATGSVTVAAPSGAIFRNKTASLRWFGSRINGELYLGNGTNDNMVWRGGTLVALGPSSTPSDLDDPSKSAFPACKNFVQTSDGVVYGAGNASAPLRVWATDRPNARFPTPEGVYSLDTSYTLINHSRATRVTALQVSGTSIIAHTDAGSIRLYSFDQSPDGYKIAQAPTKANASALNPNCVSDALGSTAYYFASDRELYREEAARGGGYQQVERRDTYLASASAADLWNAGMADITDSRHAHTQLLHDRGTGLVYLLAPLAAGTGFGVWTYHEPNDGGGVITGPIRYPNANDLVLCMSGQKAIAVAFTAGGSMLTTDLSNLLERDTWEISSASAALGTDYETTGSAPTSIVGIPYVGITETIGSPAILHSVDGVQTAMATPWDEWSASGLPTPTVFFKNATVAVLDIANEDFGQPNVIKEILSIRLQLLRNTRAYVGVFAESGGVRYGRWRGLAYPKEEKLAGLKLVGRRLSLRIIVIYFNDQPLMLRDLSVDFEMAVSN
jgi:hypothetical protein